MKQFCPVCGSETTWVINYRPEEMNIRGEKITVQSEYSVCSQCQTEFEDMNSDIDPYDAAYEEYRRQKGMLQPAQIRDFRKRYGLTQKELSKLLGLGDITLSRYENGALQDEVHDRLLQLAMEPHNLLRLINEQPSALSDEKRTEIIKKLESTSNILHYVQARMNRDCEDEFNGYRLLDLKKTANVIRFFCYNREIFKTKLLKLLFYVDFKYFKLYQNSITGLKYAHLPFGPVPDQYELIIGTILQFDYSIYVQPKEIGNCTGDVFFSSSPPDMTEFSYNERSILIDVNTHFEDYTAKDISFTSHEEKGYQETINGALIPYSYAMVLNI